MAKVYYGDLSAWTIGGASQIDYAPDAAIEFNFDLDDGATLLSGGARHEVTKKVASLKTSLFSTVSASRVSNLDLTAFSIDAVDYISHVRSARFNFSVPSGEASGVGSLWKEPQPMPNSRDVTVSADLLVPAASATANALRLLAAICKNSDREDASVAFTMTLNSVAITLPMTVKSVGFPQKRGEMFTVSVELAGRAPISGTYISAPAGTTTLIEKAINQTATALAFVFTPHDDAGFGTSFTGNMVIESFDFSIEDSKIVSTNFSYMSTGAVAGADT